MFIYDKSGREFVVEILTRQESIAKLNLQIVFDFWKADEKTISVIYRFAYFPSVVSFMCTII